jgi:hypothetical protein
MYTQAEVFTRCDKIGVVGVKKLIDSGEWDEKVRIRHAQEWLRLQEESGNEQSPSEQLDLVKSQFDSVKAELDIANANLAITKVQLSSAKTQKNTAIIVSVLTAVAAVIIIVAIKFHYF